MASRLKARFCWGYDISEFPKFHVWVRRLLALSFLTEDVIVLNFSLLFEWDAINGEIHVEGCCVEAFKQLFQYYKSFWLRNVV